LAVTVAECAHLALPTYPDPDPFPEHMVAAFDNLSNNQIEKVSKRLREAAWARGWCRGPSD